ncbi:MAG TPA: M23 family metallopeptidase [Rhizomicrobium sp.]|nr:M23 family metallopeptidase [Rhizomicrobium sp.]
MRVDRSERVEGRSGRAVAAILFAAIALSACSHFDKEPPIADGPGSRSHFTVSVRDGDTIYSIAGRYGVSVADLIDANDLTDKNRIYTGEVLRIPGEARRPIYADRAPVPRPKPRYGRTAPVITLTSYRPHDDGSDAGDADSVIDRLANSPNDRDVSAYQDSSRDNGYARFAWPVSGRVISPFGASTTGERNDGINIAADRGTPIHAAADGVVTYSGNELKGYGNLVLIKHTDGYVTAYAHAERTLVSRGDKVSRGQVIAYTGETGDVTEPQLHFEIRHDTKPVDPRPLMMASR